MKIALAASCAIVLSACAPQAASTAEVFTYTCASGKTFSVSFDEGFTVATVKSGGATYKLPAAMSASGSRYSDGKTEFWEHQGEAMLNTPESESGSCPRKESPG